MEKERYFQNIFGKKVTILYEGRRIKFAPNEIKKVALPERGFSKFIRLVRPEEERQHIAQEIQSAPEQNVVKNNDVSQAVIPSKPTPAPTQVKAVESDPTIEKSREKWLMSDSGPQNNN